MSWHAQFEARLSLTGANADLRAALPPSAFLSALHDLHRRVARRLNREPGPAVAAAAPAPGLPAAALEEAARRLAEAAGRSLVVSGVRDVRVQTVVNRLNHLLGNYGKTLDLERPSLQYAGDDAAMDALIDDLEAGQVGALIVLDANPAHDHPRAAAFRRGLSKTSLMLSLSDRNDETASLAHAVCPDAHPLETWGDSHPHVGIYGIAQPVLAPLSATRPAVETLMMWAGHPDSAHAFQRRIWRERVFPRQTRHADFEAFWDAALRDGAAAVESESLPERAWVLREPPAPSDLPPPADGALEIDVHPGIALGDGRQANNPWLQELPDPLAKVAWGNVAALSPATAVRLGVTDGRVVELSGGNHTARLPVAIQPGMADNVVAVALGYGRPRAGDVAAHYPVERVLAIDKEPPGGADVYPFLRFGRVRVTPTGDMSLPARTQRYDVQTVPWTGQHRACARETTLAAFSQDPGAAHPPEPARGGSLWPAHPPEGPKWGMAIDLSVCTGCSACVIACQAENNIPVVGKAEVRKGREMHWLRIDRYYSGGPDRPDDAPDVVFQPMLCQQCDNAPCETVCPALATLHSRDGLNMQVYNRCVGTRYCANNCPYKVRRFNWFDYAHDDAVQNLALNPNVTVRSRGIMEKCSFCVQRIAEARMRARAEGRRPADGEIQPACMESCPADAIVFGDVTDLASRVTAASRDPRSYSVLGELGTAPAVRYLAKVRNREL
jgi:molybdopterin-containing oxidoreductase family iron-sulfur binding subunit